MRLGYISKGVREDIARINAMVAGEELKIRQAFRLFLTDVKSPPVIRMIRSYLDNRDFEAAFGIVDSYVVRLGDAISHAFQVSGVAESTRLAAQLARISRVAISFDPTNPRAANIMRVNRLRFIADFSRAQREATRNALTLALQRGASSLAAARTFRDSIGLTDVQMTAVNSYRALLERGSVMALDRALRNRRFDTTVSRAIELGKPLTNFQMERMVDAYQRGMLGLRAETIARTEMQRTLNLARQESLLQSVDQTGIDPDRVVRTWRATQDERTRDTHAEMDGQERGINEPFESPSGALLMYPGDPEAPAGEIINCRCVVLTELR